MIYPFSKRQKHGWPPTAVPNRRRRDWARILGWTVVPALLLVTWQVAAVRRAQPWLYPSVTVVAGRLAHPLADHFNQGSLFHNALVSMLRVLAGFLLAAIAGLTLGVLMGSVRLFRGLLEPLVEVLRPLCPIAWLPFALAVFGLTTVPQVFGVRYSGTILDHVQLGMVFVLFWGAFFPILINTLDGVAGVRRQYVALAWTLGASRGQSFLHVYLPGAMPMILTGLRQGIGMCWFVIIAAEMLPGSDSGIGYLLMYAADQLQMDIVIAAMLIIGVVGAVLNFGALAMMRAFVRWHGKEM